MENTIDSIFDEEIRVVTPAELGDVNDDLLEADLLEEPSTDIINEEEGEEKKDTSQPKKVNSEEVEDIAVAVYQTLTNKGYITEDPEFKGTFEALDEVFNEIPEIVKSDMLEPLNVKGKQIVEYILNKGEDLTDDDVVGFLSLYNQQTTVSTLEDAKKVITDAYKNQGITDEEQIEMNIEFLESKGEDGEEVIKVANKFLKAQAQDPDDVLEAQRKAEAEQLERIKEFDSNFRETLESSTYSKQMKRDLLKMYKQQDHVDVYTEAFQSPESLLQLVNLAKHYNPKTKQFDLKAFAKQAASKEIEKIKDRSIQNTFSSIKVGRNFKPSSKTEIMKNLKPIDPTK
jgi:hypothetical protein